MFWANIVQYSEHLLWANSNSTMLNNIVDNVRQLMLAAKHLFNPVFVNFEWSVFSVYMHMFQNTLKLL